MTESTILKLSSHGMVRVALFEPKDFQFIVMGRSYFCSRSEAVFLSPRVCDLLHLDPTMTQYVIDDISDSTDIFSTLLKLMREPNFNPSLQNHSVLEKFGISLGNTELIDLIIESALSTHELNISNVVARLEMKWIRQLEVKSEIDFIAGHISKVEQLNSLGIDELEAIVSSSVLLIETEDWLLNFIIEKGNEYLILLRYVHCQYLSLKGIERFIDSITPDLIDGMMWSSICDRLCQEGCSFTTNRLLTQRLRFSGRLFDGIIAALNEECSGNACTKGLVDITASSLQRGSCYQLVDYSWEGELNTNNQADSWMCLEFKTGRAIIDSYSIKSFPGSSWPKNWVIEVSDDKSSWAAIDRRENTTVLCAPMATHHFECQSPNGYQCKCVRMRNIGLTHGNNHYLCLCNIEFFGHFMKNCPS
jgi:hypothetical protein